MSDEKKSDASEEVPGWEPKYASETSKLRRFIGRVGKVAAYGVIVACGLFLFLVVLWAIDLHFINNQTPHNLKVAGVKVAGWTKNDIATYLQNNKQRIENAEVTIRVGKQTIKTTPAALGLAIEPELTAENARNYLRHKSFVSQFGSWFSNWKSSKTSPLVFVTTDFDTKWFALPINKSQASVEPSVSYQDGKFVVTKGKTGFGTSTVDVLDELSQTITAKPTTVVLVPQKLVPRFSDNVAEGLAKKAEDFEGPTLSLTINGQTKQVDSETYKKWFRSSATSSELVLTFDREKTEPGVDAILVAAETPPKNASFTIVGGAVQIVPEATGMTCCDDVSISRMNAAVFQAKPTSVTLGLRTAQPSLTKADLLKLGVIEPVGTFTTRYPPGQPRVKNIHKISDLVRGQVILPNKTFSVNNLVGPRTTEKGFVVDHAIMNGVFVDSVGGGISQFGTTTFNAAFFAGLQIPEYQAHSIYISRYPYGREATLSFPHPDLKLKNNTPYGVLIWPTYTGNSLTVTLYSTKYINADQTAQTTAPHGPCTLVRTERTRTWVSDGHQSKDYFRALYQPKEGVLC